MPLPSAWVDRIFDKLTLVYGAHFLSRWAGLDIGLVKDDWARELNGFEKQPEALRYGLEHLPVDQPPNVLQFRSLCNSGPRADALPALPGPDVKPDPERLRALMSRLSEIGRERSSMSPAEQCIRRIDAIAASRGGIMSEAQKHVRACCVKVTTGGGAEMTGSGFTPIDPAALPPGMREVDPHARHVETEWS